MTTWPDDPHRWPRDSPEEDAELHRARELDRLARYERTGSDEPRPDLAGITLLTGLRDLTDDRDPDDCCHVCCASEHEPLGPLPPPWFDHFACPYCHDHAPTAPGKLTWWLGRAWSIRLALIAMKYGRDARTGQPTGAGPTRAVADTVLSSPDAIPDSVTREDVDSWPMPPMSWDQA